ncbi:hypothetical protein Tco_0698079 [Tanacetum coccineum]
MGDENPIRTLRDYSKPIHEGYKNTIELPVGNNVVPLRSDTIRLVQNGCSFHGLRSEDPNQHLKDFLKLVDSLDLDGENRERTRLRLFQFSLRDEDNNWLERLPARSITSWEDLSPSPQPQALGTTFEARVRDYMAAHSKRMERFGLLKELTTSKAPEKVLIREEAKFLVTKNVNSISLARGDEERSDKMDKTFDNTLKPTVFSIWKAFGGNTRDLGSFGKETDKAMNLHQHLLRISTQKLETASPNTRDAITTHLKTRHRSLDVTKSLDQDNHLDRANKEEEQYEEDRCELLGNPHQELPVCKIGRFEVIKYSFGPTEKYIAIKECEHDDWTRTKENA